VPFGGAGPLVAAQIAEDLGIDTIVVPPNPGVMSAYGLLAADYTKVESVTRRAAVDAEAPELVRRTFAEMRERLHGQFRELGLDGPFMLAFSADMRFIGQAFEVTVALPIEALATLSTATLFDAFAAEHQRVFFHGAASDRKVEIVAFRLAMARPLEKLPTFREVRGAWFEARSLYAIEHLSRSVGRNRRLAVFRRTAMRARARRFSARASARNHS